MEGRKDYNHLEVEVAETHSDENFQVGQFVVVSMKSGFQAGPTFPYFLLGSYFSLLFLEKALLSLLFLENCLRINRKVLIKYID